jgi:hypothetical protein
MDHTDEPKARYQANDLFQKGKNWELNACVGTNGGPYDYSSFSDGFFTGANELVELMRTDNSKIDVCVYPIVSNYRQGLELGIKHCIISAQQVSGGKSTLRMDHDLNELWNDFLKIRKTLPKDLCENEDETFMTAVIKDFSKTDPKGMVFRYPEDRMRKQQIDAFELINLDVLQTAMRRCQSILEDLEHKFEYMLEEYE